MRAPDGLSDTHYQLHPAGACGFTHWRTTTPIGGCIGHTSGCLKSAKVRVFEAKCEQIAQAYGLVMS